jgi:hypothetical protein
VHPDGAVQRSPGDAWHRPEQGPVVSLRENDAGHVHTEISTLDLTGFERHRALLRFGYNF